MRNKFVMLVAHDTDILGYRGDSIHTREILRTLLESGVDVCILSLSSKLPRGSGRRIKKFLAIPKINIVLVSFYSALYALMLIIKNIGDIVKGKMVILSRTHLINLPTLLIKKLSGSPLILRPVNMIENFYRFYKFGSLIKIFKIFEYSLYKNADLVLPQGIVLKKKIESLIKSCGGDASVIYLPGGVDVDLFKPIDMLSAKRKLGLREETYYFSYIGNFDVWYDFKLMLESFKVVLKDYSAGLLLVGGGVLRREIEKTARKLGILDAVKIIDWVPHRVVPLYINASVAGLIPWRISGSRNIGGLPLKLLEYLACGVPVVSLKNPICRFFLHKPFIRFVNDDPIEFSNAMMQFLRLSSEEKKHIAIMARTFVVQNFS